MKDQLLYGAGGAVVGGPGFELGVVGQEQLGQVIGVFGVVLGAAGDEGLAIFLEGDGIDRVEGDPGIGFQETDQVDGGLFQAEGDAGLGMVLAQLEQPFPEGFGSRVEGGGSALAGGGVEQVQIGLAIGAIQADDQVIGMGGVHGLSDVVLAFPRA